MSESPASLQPDALMQHMRAICKDIGPRPSTSAQERQTADYVKDTLHRLGISDVQRQPFNSQNSSGWITIPSFVSGLLGIILAVFGGQWGKITGSVLLMGSGFIFRQSLLTIPPFFERWIARWPSENVIARAPATGVARQTVYLVGHLDSQKQRFQFPPSPYWAMRTYTSLPIVVGVLGGLLLLVAVVLDVQVPPLALWLAGAAYVYGLIGAIYDETQPHVEGANDNATAVSLLLGAAQALHSTPLQHTDVVLLFTGCEEVGCVGMEKYLQAHAPSTDTTLWIDIEMVGTGELCYVTGHGISHFSRYRPHPRMVALAEETARKHPNLRVSGKGMVILEEISNLWRRKYKAICLAGYNAQGMLANWHRLSDNLDQIEPETLCRAACYTWALLQEIDTALQA